MNSSYETPSSSPVPFLIALWMLSLGMLTARAASMAARRRALPLGSPPPMRADVMSSRVILVKAFPRAASAFPFLCLMELHLLWPDIVRFSVCRFSNRTAATDARRFRVPQTTRRKKQEPLTAVSGARALGIRFGGDLLSHGGHPAVPSALESL